MSGIGDAFRPFGKDYDSHTPSRRIDMPICDCRTCGLQWVPQGPASEFPRCPVCNLSKTVESLLTSLGAANKELEGWRERYANFCAESAANYSELSAVLRAEVETTLRLRAELAEARRRAMIESDYANPDARLR